RGGFGVQEMDRFAPGWRERAENAAVAERPTEPAHELPQPAPNAPEAAAEPPLRQPAGVRAKSAKQRIAEGQKYAGGVVGTGAVERVWMVGSGTQRADARDTDLLYEMRGELPADRGEAEEAVERMLEQSNIDLDRYDTFIKVGERYFHVSSGAGRGVIENTEYAREQEGRPKVLLAEQATREEAPTEPPAKFTPEQTAALRRLAEEAGWSEVGGKIIRNPQGEVVGRTHWLPRADWWPGRPGRFNEKQTAEIIEKGLNGRYLGKTQRVYFDFLRGLADEMLSGESYEPTSEHLQDAGLEQSVDTEFDVGLVARAAEIDEAAVERAAIQYVDDDAGFLRAAKAIVDAHAKAAESGQGRTRLEERDLLGDDTRQAQALADETRRRDERRSPNADVPLETGDASDMFSQASKQLDLVQQAKRETSKPPAPTPESTSGAEDLSAPFVPFTKNGKLPQPVYRSVAKKLREAASNGSSRNDFDLIVRVNGFPPADAEKIWTDARLAAKPGKNDLGAQLASLSDDALDAMVDAAVEQTGAAETEKPAKQRAKRTRAPKAPGEKKPRIRKTATRAERTDVTQPEAVERTTKEIAKSLGYNLTSAGENALKGLTELFGGPGKLNSGLTFDEDTYARAKPHFEAMLRDAQAAGKDLADFIRSLVNAFGSGIKPYLRRFAADLRNGNALGQPGNLERDRGNAAATAPGNEAADVAVAGEAASGAGQPGEGAGIRGGLAEGDARVLNGGAPAAGEQGDQSLRADEGQRLLEGIPAGSDDGGRGASIGDRGVPPERQGASESAEALDRSTRQRDKLAAQAEANRLPVVPGDAGNIDSTLPYLLDGQRADVKKAEDRFAKPDGYGMLFTNGTGTGKTFTGLGVVRRFVSRGKTNILIVAPSDKIIGDWVDSGKALGLELTQLPDTRSAGKDIVITTYANLGQNLALGSREWDLVVADEAHYLTQGKDGAATDALDALRALTLHPDGIYERTRMLNPELARKIDEIEEQDRKSGARTRNPALEPLYRELTEKRKAVEADVKARQGEQRPRALFLTATPFAYEKTIDWANGYLFDYDEGKESDGSRGYNVGSNRDQFFVLHFGYRLRYNRLTEPDEKVDRGLMQRQFNGWLKKRGVLSGRVLEVDADYDRRFVLIESRIGNRIDALLDWLRDTDGLDEAERDVKYHMAGVLRDKFDHLSRRYLLEAIKAEASVPYVRKALALGRKVVVFHDFKKGGGFNPFVITAEQLAGSDTSVRLHDRDSTGELKPFVTIQGGTQKFSREAAERIVSEYNRLFDDVIQSDIGSMRSPLDTYRAEFPDVLIFNGDVPAKQRRANVAEFNDDAAGPRVILVQSAAGKEGISLHDTTGKHQRVLLNLGLPTQPTTAIQQEGRIYRVGQRSDAAFRYFNTGTSWEKWAFATTIAQRASAAENLAQGEQARALKDAFIAAFQEADEYPPGMDGEGKGGKERDRAANEALSEFDRAVAFYWGTEKKSSRTKAREGTDYFATPEPVGLKMMEWAGVRPGEKLLEPSAGHGAIARWAPSTAAATAIEPSNELAARLAMVFDGDIKQQRFEDLNVVNKYDTIVMNPPFGRSGSTAIEHLDKAVKHLRDRGRIVALLPRGPAADAKFEKWYEERKGVYQTANIVLPNVTFERAATRVAARIVILDKVDDINELVGSPGLPAGITRELDDIEDIRALFERIRDMEMPARPAPLVKPEAEKAATPAPAGTFAAAQTKHTKTGADLFVAKITRRLSNEEYQAAKSLAKQHGGYYSSFKGAGAIPGFQFKTAEARDAFIAAAAPASAPAEGEAATEGGESFSLGFYSELRAAAENLKQERGTAEQMLSMLRKTPGVKEEEIAWTGLDDYLKAKGGQVTKDEILSFLDQNGVQVEQVTLGEAAQEIERRIGDLKVSLDQIGYTVDTDYDGAVLGIIDRAAETYYTYDDGRFVSDEDKEAPFSAGGLAKELADAVNERMEAEGNPGAGGTVYERFTLPGGTNYREVLLTLPLSEKGRPEPLAKLPPGYDVIIDPREPPHRRYGVTPPGQIHARPMGGRHATREEAIAEALTLVNNKRLADWAVDRERAAFHSSHFSPLNILAHVRLKDRTATDGSRVLFVEEFQSDWAQQGRRQGFADPEKQADVERRVRALGITKPMEDVSLRDLEDAEGQARTPLQNDFDEHFLRRYHNIPRGPFVGKTEAWASLAFKRVLRMAVDGGYDAVAWTTGEQQAERYDLRKHIARVTVEPDSHSYGLYQTEIRFKDGKTRRFARMDDAELAEQIGKELADKAITRIAELNKNGGP
ncbi:MAG TPA: strawberry notch C-terminal domain-containing protein, partial [Gammaproteobacteria bacterium]|nr:strawberry notch C-terminal domain-containing protein [Gammaproteobacteria bacterium]